MQSATISILSVPDGNNERLTIGGTTFQLATTQTSTITLSGTTFSVAYSAGTRVFTITESGSSTMPNAALEALFASSTYANIAGTPATSDRFFSFAVSDGTNPSNVALSTINVQIENPPTLDLDSTDAQPSSFTVTYEPNAAPVAIASANTLITDPDSTNMLSATITLTNHQTGDALSLLGALPAGISATAYSSATGQITLSGLATIAEYQTAIEQIGYASTSSNPADRTISVTVSDGGLSSNIAISTIDVRTPPTATPSTSSGAEDAATIAVDLAGTDPDGTVDFVTVTTLPPVSEGVLYLADGTTPIVAGTPITAAQAATLVFTPTANFNGTVTVPFTVTDNHGSISTSANEVITVTPVIDLPTAIPSTSSGAEDAPTISVDLTGTDPDGTVDFVTITTLPLVSEGVLFLADGTTPVLAGTPVTAAQAATLVFTPAVNFNGTVTIPFIVTDNDGNVSAAAANEVITVTPVIDLPTATPSTSSGVEDAPTIAVDLAGIDPDGTVDFVTITTLPPVSEGVLYLADGTTAVVAGTPITAAQAATFVFTPATNFNGTVTIPFTVTDNDGNVSASANEVITVTPVIDLPTATPSTSSGAEDAPTIAVDLAGTDPDGTVDFVTIMTLPPVGEGILYLADGTTPVVAGTPVTAAQAATLVFTPAANFNGTVTIPFTVTDNDGNVSASAANEVITVTPVIDLPTATPSTSSGAEDAPTIAVDLAGTDPDGTVDFVTITTLPPVSEGVLYLADGTTPLVAGTPVTAAQAATLVFTPAANFNGTVTIPFTVTDNDGNVSASAANEVITVTPAIDLPTATPSTSSGAEDAPTIAVDLAGTDPDGTVDFITVTTLPPVSEGVLYLADGTTPIVAGTPVTAAQAATLVFTPAANFNGTVTIPFTVTDNDGNVSAFAANEVITVTPVIDLPTATPSTSSGAEDAPTIAVDLAGTDPDGTVDFVTVTTLPPVSEGVLYLADGTTPVVAGTSITAAQAATLVFTPAANFTGTVTIPFTVTDNDGNVSASAANEVITVTPVIDLPNATPSTSSGAEDAPTIPVDLAGTDPDGTVDFVTITTLPPVSEGVLYLADGTTPVVAGTPVTAAQAATLVFTPAVNFNGTVTIPFTVTDNDGNVSASTASEVITVTPGIDLPTATPSTSNGAEDAPTIAVDLTGTDPDGTVDFVTITTLPPASEGVLFLANGTTPVVAGTPVTAAQAATLVFTPAANFTGTVTIPFTVTDNDGNVSASPANEVITFTPVIDLPTATPSTSSGAEDAPTIAVDLAGTDPDGTVDFVTVTTLPPVSEGVLYLADGTTPVVAGTPVTAAQAATLVFTPAANFTGTVTIPFTVTDNDGNVSASPANEVITITPVIDLPNATPSTSSGAEDAPTIAVDLAGTDSDGTVDFVTVTTLPPVSEGVLYLADGTTPVVAGTPVTAAQAAMLVFTPAASFNGTVTIPFTVTDNDGNVSASAANEVITVTPVIDLPTATPSTSSGAEDASTIAVDLAGTDPDGTVDFVTVTTLPPASEGVLFLADGTTPVVAGTPVTAVQAATLVFTPAANFNGTVTIPFTVTDNDGHVSTSANEVITVTPVIDLPTATPSTSSGAEDAPTIAVDLAGTDPDGTVDFVTVTTLPPVSEGVLYLADGTTPVVAGTPVTAAQAATLVFTPAANFNGTVTIPFTVTDNDGNVSASPANEVITVTPVIDLPNATPSTSSGAEDAPTIPVDLAGTDPDGTVDFVTITTLPPVSEGVLYLADGTTPVVAGTTPVVAGTPVTAAQAVTLVFTPAANFNGTVTIPFTVTDNDGNVSASPANEVITVTPVIDLPNATPSTSSGAEDAPTIAVDLAGTDPDGTVDFVTVTTLPPVSEGMLYLADGTTPVVAGTSITAAQAATLVFTPAANFTGTVTIPFTVTDNDGNVSTSTANEVITVTPAIDLPTATPSTSSGAEDAPTIAVDLAGTDPDGTVDFVTITTLPPVSEGVLHLADGTTPLVAGTPITAAQAATLVFTPAANFNGTVMIPFTVTDNDGNVSVSAANEVITVTPVIDLPTATPSTSSGAEDAPTIAVDLTGTDPGGTVDFVTITTLPPVSEGVLYLADGTTPVVAGTPITAAQAATLVFTPAANFNGTVTIPFTVTDNDGNVSASANEVITVAPVIDLPTATPSTSSGAEDAPTIAVDLAGTDPDGTVDFVTITTLPPVSEGVLYLPDGTTPVVAGTPVTAAQAATLVFTPAVNFNGTVTIPFTVTDNDGNVSASTASEVITVTPGIDLPTATPSTSNGAEDAPTIAVDLTGTDPDGTVDFVTITTLPPVSEGVLYLADGTTPVVAGTPVTAAQAATLVFTPAANFNGTVTIPFTVTDNDGNVSASTANEVITVTPVIDLPTATPSTSNGAEDAPTIAVDLAGTDPDGTVDFVTITTLPPVSEGVLYLADGTTPLVAGTPITAAQAATLVFTPAANFNGTVTIPFTVTDNDGNVSASPANEVITITPVIDPPTATPSTSVGNEDDPSVTINLGGTDPGGTVDFVTVTALPPTTEGTLYLADGTTPVVAGTPVTAAQAATLVFTPAINFNGTITIPFAVTDNDGNNSPPANETITIVAINDAPVASDDIAQTEAEQHVIINALANDLDVDGDPISVVSATSPNGIVNINSDGTLTFQPASGYSGIGVINYTVSDGNGGVHSATINVDVRATSHITIQPTAPTDPFVTQSTSEPLHVDGALLDAITGVRSLNGISNELTEHGIVTAAANQVSSLNGIAASDAVGTSERPQPLSDERAWAIVQALNDTGYQGSANSWDAHALTGFSLRMNLLGSETGSSSSAQIIIESLVRDQTLIIQITNSVPDATKSVQKYRISQANGQPLPNWLDRAGKSLVIGQRPPNIDRLDLSVTVIYTDGSFEEKAVQIDTKSGDIKLLELKQEANLNRTFSEQFTVKSPATEQEVTDLAEMLKR